MRIWIVIAACSCGPKEPPPKPVLAPLPPPASASVAVAPSASAPPLPSALVVPNGIETRGAPSVAVVKGSAAVSCRTIEGTLADEVVPPNWAKIFQACKAPSGARFVFRIDAGKTRTAKGTIDREGADEKIARCVSDALVKAGTNLVADASDRPQTWDCYVAFY